MESVLYFSHGIHFSLERRAASAHGHGTPRFNSSIQVKHQAAKAEEAANTSRHHSLSLLGRRPPVSQTVWYTSLPARGDKTGIDQEPIGKRKSCWWWSRIVAVSVRFFSANVVSACFVRAASTSGVDGVECVHFSSNVAAEATAATETGECLPYLADLCQPSKR